MDNDREKVPLFGSSRILVSGDWTPTTTNQRRLLNRTQYEGSKKRAIELPGLARSSYCSSSNAIESASYSNGPSMSSLFGHMRFLPEREWRGIRRPSSPKNSSPSSTISGVVAPKTDDHIHLPLSLSSILGWSEICSKRKGLGKRIKLEPALEDYEQISETSKPYTCKICNKSFRSYQALGGHSSGHSKRKRKLPVAKVEESGSALAVEIAVYPAQPGKSPKFEEGGSSRCQYLTGPVDAAPPSQPAGQGDGSRAARNIFDFDLNKLPDMEPLGDGSQTNPFLLDD